MNLNQEATPSLIFFPALLIRVILICVFTSDPGDLLAQQYKFEQRFYNSNAYTSFGLHSLQPKKTYKTGAYLPTIVFGDGTTDSGFELKDEILPYNMATCAFLGKLLAKGAKPNKLGEMVIDSGFTLLKCIFQQDIKAQSPYLVECKNSPLILGAKAKGYFSQNTFNQPFILSGIWGNLNVNGSFIPHFTYVGSKKGSLEFQNNTIEQAVIIEDVNNSQLFLNQNVFLPDTGIIYIRDSNFDRISIGGDQAKYLRYGLFRDTITNFDGSLFLNDNKEDITQEFNFSGSTLQSLRFEKNNKAAKQIVIFSFCTFLSDGTLELSNIDTLEFAYCTKVGSNIRIYSSNNGQVTHLKIINSDLSKFNFEYDENFKLVQYSDEFFMASLYEQLLLKFASEKRTRSYQRVDIEYFRYRNNNVVNFLAMIWWYYGYEKWYIVIWTFSLLVLFSIINYKYWKDIIPVYPIKRVSDISDTENKYYRFCKIFVFTGLIFFSLKVDFEKLSFKNTGLLIYFFGIYLTGLFCLFYIVKAILQL